MRLMVVDDHVLFREGLVSLISNQPDIEVVGEAGSVKEALDKAPTVNPDIILMDYSMPDGSGVEASLGILAKLPGVKIIFLTISEGDDHLMEALRSGAKGYLIKNLSVSQLLIALRSVMRGEAAISPAMMSRVLEEIAKPRAGSLSKDADGGNSVDRATSPHTLLTSRELEVLQALAQGESNKQIAARLFISENTVKNHVHNLLDKLNLRNRREAVDFARKYGLLH